MELPVLVTRLDERDDVLIVQTYLMDAEVPFLCGKRTLDLWNFKIDGRRKILEIESKSDRSKKEFRMINTLVGHHGIVLEKRGKNYLNILFMEDAQGDLCSYKAVRKVHEVN